ncbi:MAG: hypothetical protein KDD89_11795 [Anaerolineales bacterium]|nr:hypothetical protein [Anaerolineales bacterium]
MSRQQDFITEARQAATNLYQAIVTLEGLQSEWNAQNYSVTLADGEGENAGYTASEVGSVVFDTANAMRVVLSAGHATNLTNLL